MRLLTRSQDCEKAVLCLGRSDSKEGKEERKKGRREKEKKERRKKEEKMKGTRKYRK